MNDEISTDQLIRDQFDRTMIIDDNFINAVHKNQFPKFFSHTTLEEAKLSQVDCWNIFQSMIKSRHCDLVARELKAKGLGYYTIGSSGHEANAGVGYVFRHTDMAFLHYRSAAFMLERARAVPQTDMTHDILCSLFALAEDPIANGRHKVFGNKTLYVPPQTSTIASHLPKAVGTAASIKRAQRLNIPHPLAHDSVVLCSFGDASVNHASAQSAFNVASWLAYNHYPLPLVFICEDNGWGISVKTPPGWIKSSLSSRFGIHYLAADGFNIADTVLMARQAQQIARKFHQPVFLHIRCVRLLGHAGTDFELQYRDINELEQAEANDPLIHTARLLIENGIKSKHEIIEYYQYIKESILNKALALAAKPTLESAQAVMQAIIPSTQHKNLPKLPSQHERLRTFGKKAAKLSQRLVLSQQINFALIDLMLQYPEICLFGEDVAKKGGVYRVTQGLLERFGSARVFDTILDETSILGYAIGHAHNGFLPIAEIQFLAYLHNAEDQLRGEAATLSFFSAQQFSNPMIIRIAGYAYQKGFGGHFHNDNSIAVLRDLPGVIIATPSCGADAVGMLRECVELAYIHQRIIVFIEPIALYMTKDCNTYGDQQWMDIYPGPDHRIKLGEPGIYGESDEIAIISYANGFYLSQQAAKILREHYKLSIKVIDCRWLAPLDEEALLAAAGPVKYLIVVDECRKTGSLSETLIKLFALKTQPCPRIACVTAKDSFIPLGPAANLILPSRDDIVQAVIELVGS